MLSIASETGAAVVLAGVLVLLTFGGPAVGVIAADKPTAVSDDGLTQRVYAFQAADNETNSSAVRHENPRSADGESDTDDIEAYLANSLANKISTSTIELSRGEYELAKSYVDDQYREQLSQYVDVAGPAERGVSSDTLNTAGRDQRRIINKTREFNEVYERYEEARQDGNTERARQFARELDDLSENISQATRRQRQNLRALATNTSADINDSVRDIQSLNESIHDRRQAALESEFVRTELNVEADGQQASFRDPLAIRGRLTDANGTALGARSVTIAVGERNYTVRTDSQGQFSLRYRPTTVGIDTEEVTVRYVPAETSEYRSASARVPVTLEQTTASLSFVETTTTVRYGETVAMRGRLTVGSVPVPNVPVGVAIGDRRISLVRTDEDGFFEIQSTLPADIVEGEQPLNGRIVLSDRAVVAQNARTGVTVVPTDMSLTLTGIDVTADGLEVSGRLATDAGLGVPEQQVDLRLDGTTVTTGTTGQEGNVTLNASVDTDRVSRISTVTLRYDGSGTNLDSAAVQRDISLGNATEENFGSRIDDIRGIAALLVGLVVSAIFGSGLYVELRRLDPSQDATVDPNERGETVTDTTDSDSRTSGAEELNAAGTLLSRAATDDAVQTAYFAVRDQMPDASASGDLSHWQYYESMNGALDDGTNEEFYRLTELYEWAAFAERETTMAEAREAVEAGWSLVDAPKPNGSGTDGN